MLLYAALETLLYKNKNLSRSEQERLYLSPHECLETSLFITQPLSPRAY